LQIRAPSIEPTHAIGATIFGDTETVPEGTAANGANTDLSFRLSEGFTYLGERCSTYRGKIQDR